MGVRMKKSARGLFENIMSICFFFFVHYFFFYGCTNIHIHTRRNEEKKIIKKRVREREREGGRKKIYSRLPITQQHPLQ